MSLSRPLVPWNGRPGFRDPCVPGAVGVGVGTLPLPHGVRPCGHLERGVIEGVTFQHSNLHLLILVPLFQRQGEPLVTLILLDLSGGFLDDRRI